ncbi:elongation factor P--(R)-beta-lysine ligase [Kushneria pakistanensis]|uniref:Elongation factor P--(R)-beta-lysine ligase n=1 Tax=Kushneria pakistanensis TaxID=1508770 RepID=A0ABQ3FNN1_9GAMM|nr:EF-P lysine aminoacylase EpmA [Kushneria pakistanensis]GHC30582.1 elongation factor P--(R)-beta-lysine ligase [Kushneria pakistanensis]
MSAADWRPGATIEVLHARAAIMRRIRDFFHARDVLEVETPVLGHAGSSDVHLDSLSLSARTPAGDTRLWLQTSPEYHMKRLLAAGSGPIFQLSRVFRDGEAGRRHNIEFTMLEWYRPGFALEELIQEVADLIETVLASPLPQVRLRRYRELFTTHFSVDPLQESPEMLAALRDHAARHAGADTTSWSRDDCCDLLMSLVIEPTLGRDGLDVVVDYPASQAALARKRRDRDGTLVASRFEVYLEGIELANGFDELTDADEQQARFEKDNQQRLALGKPCISTDQKLIDALHSGMPAGCGVALGIDRLIMLALEREDIDSVMAFSLEKC